MERLKQKVRKLRDLECFVIDGWKEKYRTLPNTDKNDDRDTRIARVIAAGETVQLIDYMSFPTPGLEDIVLDQDPDANTVTYALDKDSIDRFIKILGL